MVRDKHLVLDEQVKLYIPLWWHGQKSKLPDSSSTHCDLILSGAYFKEKGYWFDGIDDYLIDSDSRKVLCESTEGEWLSILLTDGDVPKEGSIQGTGTKLYLNITGTNPKITGKIILYPEYCPSLTHLRCNDNSISTLDISALMSLVYLYCNNNSISTLDISALTSLVYLYCGGNSISTLDILALTSLTNLNCSNNSISTLDVSALTSLTYLSCSGNSISTLDVSALTSLTGLYCHNNSMNSTMVDTVLCDMDAHGTSNGTLDISNNAAPGASGITAKNNLIARGWTVTTD